MTQEEIAAVLAEHGRWLRGEGGKRASLTGASLTGARLYGARLDGANLNRANLTDASLTDASLTGARLTGADLTDASLTGARLDGANLYGNTVLSILRRATRADGYEFFLWHCREGFFIKAGCRFFTHEEALAHRVYTRAGTPLGDETMDILAFFAAAMDRLAESAE